MKQNVGMVSVRETFSDYPTSNSVTDARVISSYFNIILINNYYNKINLMEKLYSKYYNRAI